ncbi:MAG TPA: tetratricopeptide repeat protein [Polyangia bacterium]|nr:tetratricopeptide repeat protein [Polyangia bacterium]
MRFRASLVAPLALVLLASSSAAAADADPGPSAIDRVVDANREALSAYKSGQFAQARKLLMTALDQCEAAGLERHPVAARTHVHLGVVLLGGYGRNDAASKQFAQAFAIEPGIQLTPGLETPVIRAAFDEAAVLAPGAASASGVAPASAAPDQVSQTEADGSDAPMLARTLARPDDADDQDEAAAAAGDVHVRHGLELRLLGGPGGGWANGAGELNVDSQTGAAPFSGEAFNHLTASVGYWLRPTWMLSLDGRFQRVAGPTIVDAGGRTYHPASGAIAAFATATWSPRTGSLRPFVSASLGAGHIREVVTFTQLHDCGAGHHATCVDTVGGGPALAGAAAGLTLDVAARVSLVASVGAQAAAPTSTFNLDANLGVAVRP